jgi:hypothetical protein
LLARLRVRRRLSLLLLLLLLLLLARLRFGSHLCSTPSSCDGVECVFAFPTGAARHRARRCMDYSDCGVRTIRQPTGERLPRRRIAAWRRWVAPAVLSDMCLCTLMTADRVPSLHRLARSWGRTACTNC